MKRTLTPILFFISLGVLIAQTPAVYTGRIAFTYSGAVSGTFDAETLTTIDTLALPDNGAIALTLADTTMTQVFMAGFQAVGDQVYSLAVLYLKDTTGALNAQTWNFPPDITNPVELFLFVPEIDSAFVSGVIGSIDTSSIDSSNIDSLIMAEISTIAQEAYAGTGGSVNLTTSGTDSLDGNFSLTCLKLPFSIITVTAGVFSFDQMTIPIVSTTPEETVPTEFALQPASPNPFNPVTRIAYSLDRNTEMSLTVYNIKGELVERLYRGWNSAGVHHVTWDASQYASGLYFIRLQSAGRGLTQKALLLK